ncbi:MAG: energy transducer TonB [Kaistia sp. SCN 65-12]|uniref:energy transducer TonB family protein n=1 Tax=Nitrobacter sp. 62-23 TaxID=1895798 RepID=UPI0008687CE5|nr:energy transducer TonB [Nitrobacter sp. 62-23]ODT14692.1 MAG: energy transducer TonB [Kaistia sp. SCN 65-12]OJV01662.1 MAG: energy transducer TonB [Nitrobacter sp. 62-23]
MRIDWRDPDGRADGALTTTSVLRWSAAGLAVVALHAGGIWLALHWPAAAEPPGDPPAAIMMELAPLAVAPEVPQQDIAPGPQMEEAEEQVEPEKPVEEKKVEPEPDIQPVETEIKPPELPKIEKAEVVLPSKVEPKPKPKPKKKKQKAAPRTTAPPSSQAQRADRAAAPAEGMASSMSPASWRGALMAHLNRHKRFPSGAAGTGVATVAFTIDRSGRVLSARLVRSAGDAALDAEAASLPRRASPVPAPPPDVGGGSITLAVPIRFNR